MENQAVTDMAIDKIILWQDFTHPHGYRPTLRMIEYPNKKFALELSVFGRVTVVPYTQVETNRDL